MPTRAASCVLLVLAAWALPTTSARAEESFPDRVANAIDRGVAWLKVRQQKGGAWDKSWGPVVSDFHYTGGSEIYPYDRGPTAFALYTLLKCGVPADDPVVARGFDLLDSAKGNAGSNYETAALVLAIEARHNPFKRERTREAKASDGAKPGKSPDLRVKLPRKDKRWMNGLVDTLLRNQGDDGGWRYACGAPEVHPHDMSNTQLVMLALHAAHRCGIKIPKETTVKAMEFALRHQEQEGPEWSRPKAKGQTDDGTLTDQARGWAYVQGSKDRRDGLPSGTMTSGGMVVLLTGRDMLRQDSKKTLAKIDERVERSLLDGLAWLDRNWDVRDNPPAVRFYHYMHLWGLERVGDLRRIHLIGKHDWYREGADILLEQQHENGRWERDDTHGPKDVLNTCFALLFLDRATLTATTGR